MKIYTLYIVDDRYRVPTLLSEALSDDGCALDFARRLFHRSHHYRSIEIWDGDRAVASDLTPGRIDYPSGGSAPAV
jgi:hypothetical protein